jgi:hypothetical protein
VWAGVSRSCTSTARTPTPPSPPTDSEYLYPSEKRANHSQVDDPQNQDLERFPLLAKATQYRTVLKPGEMVFVPCRWWHTARALSPSISVGTNLLDESNWNGFMNLVSEPIARPLTAKKVLRRTYFQGLGHLLGALERVQKQFPDAARALKVPALLAPVSAAVARDPATVRMRFRVPTY